MWETCKVGDVKDVNDAEDVESDLMKVNDFFELWMNKFEIKLPIILLIWVLWMVNYSTKGIHFHEICV